jgi:hypothetical protein
MTIIITDPETFLVTFVPLDIKGGQRHPPKTITRSTMITSIVTSNIRTHDIRLLSYRRPKSV